MRDQYDIDTTGIELGSPTYWVNASTGNLILRFSDEQLSGLGQDLLHTRTYNALGALNDADSDGWRWDGERRLLLSGTVFTAGSSLTRTTGDGHETVYAWTGIRYQSAEGDGAHDVIEWDNQSNQRRLTDGSSRATDHYDVNTGLLMMTSIRYGYHNGQLTSVAGATGGVVGSASAGYAVQGVIGYASSQLASKIVGLETSFSWSSMAASAIGSIVAGSINQSSGFWNSTIRGQISAHSSAWMRDKWFGDGRPDHGQVAADAFGNALADYALLSLRESGKRGSWLPGGYSNETHLDRGVDGVVLNGDWREVSDSSSPGVNRIGISYSWGHVGTSTIYGGNRQGWCQCAMMTVKLML
ncbi:hypothetical protein [Pseudomonas sp. Irchel 3E13]|jgi:hypothetical protein|uniref:hypothetical protein n=1 Tax=Pseudomonas sp. Irchel 3E13 TaxID=2008975 RepID=UPI000BA3E152|nr:hypothetical protein [Pseudomonas sp. Irchel 3E13]